MVDKFAAAALAVLIAHALCACSNEEIYGSPRIQTTIATPTDAQSLDITISYTLSHQELTTADIEVQYSSDGLTFFDATEGIGGEGTTGLSVSVAGESHTFSWDSGEDLPDLRSDTIFIRLDPTDGPQTTSEAFTLHNFVFMVAGLTTATADFSLYELGLADGDIVLQESVTPGGDTPWDILYHDGIYYAANTVSNNVTALELDEFNSELTAISGSPFASDGTTSKFLAADGGFLFVSNVGSETLSIFDIATDGSLTLNANSNVALTGCQSLAVHESHLYVASESSAQIVVFDIQSDGELLPNAASPVSGGGLTTPRALTVVGSRLYVANNALANVAGFDIDASGALTAVTGSPFGFSQAGAEDMDSDGVSRLFIVGGGFSSLSSMTIDATGVATEDASSPKAVSGPANGVVCPPGTVVVGTTTTETLDSLLIDTDGTLITSAGSPFDAEGEVAQLEVSD